MPRGGGWRPGARWARDDACTRGAVEAEIAALPAHRQPSIRELGRRSEAAEHPFRRMPDGDACVSEQSPVVKAQGRRPLVLVDVVGRRQEVVAACPAALAEGVGIGMAVTHARVLVSDLDVRPADPQADAQLLERLALRAVRSWTPVASVAGADGLWLDLTGVAHLFGGEERLCRRIVGFCRRAGFTARIAVADTPGAAHAVARHGAEPISLVPSAKTAEALLPLPLAAIRIPGDALTAARRFGLERVGDLISMPRGPLARRLGLVTVERLDQALGRKPEPIVPLVDEEPPAVERRLLEPIGAAEQIGQVMADLLDELVELLRARGLGARALQFACDRVDGAEQKVSIGTSRPNRDPKHLLRLLSMRIERLDPGLGLEKFALTATHTEPLGATSLATILAGDAQAVDVPKLVDTLAGRAGRDALFRIGSVESHVPERAVARAAPLARADGWPAWRRPARLLARPEPLAQVVALLPDQPPRRFEWRGQIYRVANADGPERIHGEWWRSKNEVWGVRDYFCLEDVSGQRFWVFRRGDGVDAATGNLSWWLHGVFG